MAIILSNGYKGENITKLISPVPPIPFKSFEELVENQYNIISSLQIIKENISLGFKESFIANLPSMLENYGISSNMKGVQTVMLSAYDNITQSHYFVDIASSLYVYLEPNTQNISERDRYILNNSQVYLHSKYFTVADYWVTTSPLTLLYNCSNEPKLAVVSTRTDILKFQSRYTVTHHAEIENNRYKFPLSFGKEQIGGRIEGFSFFGWINSKIVQRINALQSGGFIDWHSKLNESLYKNSGKLVDIPVLNVFRPTRMSSSFLLVFFVLMAGLLLSIISFIIENRAKIITNLIIGLWAICKTCRCSKCGKVKCMNMHSLQINVR